MQVASLEEQCQDARLKCSELEAAVDALGASAGPDSLAAKYADTVRRQALVQVRHARLARQLAAATASEQALQVGLRETCTFELQWRCCWLSRNWQLRWPSEQALQVGQVGSCTHELHWGRLSTVLQLATLTWSNNCMCPAGAAVRGGC